VRRSLSVCYLYYAARESGFVHRGERTMLRAALGIRIACQASRCAFSLMSQASLLLSLSLRLLRASHPRRWGAQHAMRGFWRASNPARCTTHLPPSPYRTVGRREGAPSHHISSSSPPRPSPASRLLSPQPLRPFSTPSPGDLGSAVAYLIAIHSSPEIALPSSAPATALPTHVGWQSAHHQAL